MFFFLLKEDVRKNTEPGKFDAKMTVELLQKNKFLNFLIFSGA